MTLTEHTLNDELGNLLGRMRRRWRVQAEPLGEIEGSAQRPDVLITEDGALPVIIEHEVSPARSVEDEARNRIGLTLRGSGREIRVTIALRSPYSITQGISGAALRRRWLDCDELKYVLFRRVRGGEIERWPAKGWLQGTVRDLALLSQQAMRPGEEIDELAQILETRIDQAASAFNKAWPHGDERASAMLSEQLRLEDDGVQTRRMAMAILANALIFQQSLAPQLDGIEPPSQLHKQGLLNDAEVLQQWRAILAINYWPIFHVASEVLAWMDRPRVAARILDLLHQVNLQIEISDAARSHDLTGFVFQRLIADRKFLATFYTRPESAALLAALALPLERPLAGAGWNDALTLSALQIGDFACGTGTLLSAVYNRLGALHELHGGDAADLHQDMLEQALVGCDVLPMALHLTLTMLASNFPEIPFANCQTLLMHYGHQTTDDGGKEYKLGSLDLLNSQEFMPGWSTRPEAITANGRESEALELHKVEDETFDLVIMNPPFTRPTNHEGQHKDIPNPAYAAFGTDDEGQQAMGDRAKKDYKGTCADGNAGMGSYFLALADRKVRDSGSIALVLPQALLVGVAWEKSRRLLSAKYDKISVVTIAGEKSEDKSFSADTGMGECLIVASKCQSATAESKRARFVTLQERPGLQIEGEAIAQALSNLGQIRRMEDGPFGGTSIQIGDTSLGQVLDFPLPKSGAWQLAGIIDFTLAQTAHSLSTGRLWFHRMRDPFLLATCQLGEIAERGKVDRDINGIEKGSPRGPFDIKRPQMSPVATYPALWAHKAERERSMSVPPDSEGLVRRVEDSALQEKLYELADNVWATATCAHMNRDFQFNSQSLFVSMTPVPSIGGRAWPSVIFDRDNRPEWEQAFCVWSNSTLGVMLFWWQSSRPQGGRGTITVTAQQFLTTLDLRSLSEEQLSAAVRIFEDMKH